MRGAWVDGPPQQDASRDQQTPCPRVAEQRRGNARADDRQSQRRGAGVEGHEGHRQRGVDDDAEAPVRQPAAELLERG